MSKVQRSRAPKGTNKWWSKGGHWGWRNMKRIKGYGLISTITSTTEWSYQDNIDRATVWQLDSGPTLLLGLGAGTCECGSAGAFGNGIRDGMLSNNMKDMKNVNDMNDIWQYIYGIWMTSRIGINMFWTVFEWYTNDTNDALKKVLLTSFVWKDQISMNSLPRNDLNSRHHPKWWFIYTCVRRGHYPPPKTNMAPFTKVKV